MDRILAEQKKDDFKFKDEATEYSSDPTKVLIYFLLFYFLLFYLVYILNFFIQICQTCVKFIHNVYDTIIDTLDGRNIEIFLEEFGINVQRFVTVVLL